MRQKKRVVPIVALVFLAIMAIGIRQTESLVPSALAAQVTLRPDDPGSLSERMPVISMPGSSSHAELEVQRSSPTSGSQPSTVPGQTLAVGQAQGQIAYTGADGNLWVMAADGNNAHPVTTGLGATWDAEWSPDGSRIAFGTSSAAYVVNHDGTGLRQLAGGLHEPFAFDWSADGGRILFTAGQFGTYVVNSDGSGLAMIADNIGDHMMGAGISPDGQWVAIPAKKDNGRWGIYRHNLSNQQGEWMPGEFYCTIRSSLCPTQPFTYYADWSPDGGRIAFVGVRTEEYLCGFFQWCGRAFPAIYTLSANGGAAPVWLGDISTTQNPTGAAAFRDLDWDAGSFRLAAPGVAADGKWHVHVYNGVLVQVFGGREGEGIEKLDFAPSGSRLVTGLREGGVSSIYVVDAATGGWSAALANGTWPDWGRDAPAPTPTPTPTSTPTSTATSTPTPAPTATPTSMCPMADETTDTDEDGLPDAWEVCGVDTDGDGEIDVDLPAMGAKIDHMDIFIEIDWMRNSDEDEICTGPSCFLADVHRPKKDAMENVVEAFRNAPIWNPDEQPGINLHIDFGRDTVMNPQTGQLWLELSRANHFDYDEEMSDQEFFDDIRPNNFTLERRRVFHYVVFAHFAADGGCGTGRAWASDFVVNLGGWGLDWNKVLTEEYTCRLNPRQYNGTTLQQAGTFMHELGHNLGLDHGPKSPGSGDDDENHKPNYLSVMSYLYQTRGLIYENNDGLIDYSDFSNIPHLDEQHLDERIGLDGGDILSEYGARWGCWSGYGRTEVANGPIDWDCKFGSDGNDVSADISKDGKKTILQSKNDWQNIELGRGCIGEWDESWCAENQPGRSANTEENHVIPVPHPELSLVEDAAIFTPIAVSVSAELTEHTSGTRSQSFTFSIMNGGAYSETFNIAIVSNKDWADLEQVPQRLTLDSNEVAQYEITVLIPENAVLGDYEEISIRVSSQNNPRITDIATIWAGVGDPALVVTPTPTPSLNNLWLPMIQR